MPPHNQTVAAVSRETGISEASLYNWKKQFRAKGFIVPKKSTQAQRHYGQEALLLQARQQVYEAARQAMPQRWKGRPTRDWRPAAEVWGSIRLFVGEAV